MTTQSKRTSSDGPLLLLAIVFGFMALAGDLLFLAGTLMCLGAMMFERPGQRRMGMATFAMAAAYFFLVFSYDIGKDMAKRDNTQSAAVRAEAKLK